MKILGKSLVLVFVWCLAGLTLSIYNILAYQYFSDPSNIGYEFVPNLVISLFGALAGGVLMSFFEFKAAANLFSRKSLGQIIIMKSMLYSGAFIVITYILSTLFNILVFKNSILSASTYSSSFRYITGPLHIGTTLIYIIIFLSTITYIQISRVFGAGMLYRFLLGTYRTPRVEKRIFMFLDLNDSTMIAEKVGHVKYFQFIQEVLIDISKDIVENGGEIYKYVGDEVIITWKTERINDKTAPLKCYFDLHHTISLRSQYYTSTHGFIPRFKAGIHMGESVVGEIGLDKKEIAYSGDLLNTTARIQAKCKELQCDLLISGVYRDFLNHRYEHYDFEDKGLMPLKGKAEQVQIVAVTAAESK